MAKKTKFLSILMSAAIASSMIPATAGAEEAKYKGSADETPDNWSVSYNTPTVSGLVTNRMGWNKAQDYVGISKEAREGNSATAINIQSPNETNRTITLSQTGTFPSGTYTLSFWHKGTTNDFTVKLGSQAAAFSSFTAGEESDGWTKYSKEITLAEDAGELVFTFSGFGTNAVIDGVSLLNSSSAEMLVNGDFEAYTTNIEFAVNDIDTAVTANEWTLLNLCKADKNNINYAKCYAAPIAKYAYEGDRGMYITYADAREDDTQIFLVQPLNKDFAAETTVVLEFYAKSASRDDSIRYGFFKNPAAPWGYEIYPNSDYTYSLDGSGTDVGGGWKKYTKEITFADVVSVQGYQVPNAYSFGFVADNAASAMIDNVILYEKNDESKTNLVKNGGFENVEHMAIVDGTYTNTDWRTRNYQRPDLYKGSVTTRRIQNIMFAEPTGKTAKSGNYSLRLAYQAGLRVGSAVVGVMPNHWMQYTGYNSTDFEAGTYTISLWAKGNVRPRIGLGAAYYAGTYLTAVEGTLTEDGWQQYTGTYTVAAGQENNWINFPIQDPCGEVFYDDITIEKDGVSWLDSDIGGFENTTGSAPATDILSAVAYPLYWNAARINVAWKNPNNKSISDIRVFVDGVEYKNSIPNIDANAYNEMLIDVGSANIKAVHDVKIVATIGGKEYTTELESRTHTGDKYMNDWWWHYVEGNTNDGITNYGNAVISADRTVKNGGNASIKISACLPKDLPNVFPSLVIKSITLDTQYKYRFECDMKYDTDGPVRVKLQESNAISGWIANDGNEFVKGNEISSDWRHCTVDLDDAPYYNEDHLAEYNEMLFLSITTLVGDLWIDNVALYAVDDEGDRIKGMGNLLGDDNMEFDEYEVKPASFKMNGETIDHTAAGKVDVSTEIRNYAKGDSFNVAVFTAVYNGKELVSVEKMQKNITEKPEYMSGEVFSNQVTVDNANSTVKVMYWNGTDLITPVADAAVLSPLVQNN